MPYLVNGQIVTDRVVGEEKARLARDPHWQTIKESAEREQALDARPPSSDAGRHATAIALIRCAHRRAGTRG